MTAPFNTYTLVLLENRERHCCHRLRFGTPVASVPLDKHRSLAAFKPFQTFGYIRWKRNNYGTQSWLLFICAAVQPSRVSRVAGVHPGAEMLFRARGKVAVKRTLSWLDRLEKHTGHTLEILPASYWRQAQNAAVIRNCWPKYSPTRRTNYA